MSLINCPACGNQRANQQGSACPSCGHVIPVRHYAPFDVEDPETWKGCGSGVVLIGAILCGLAGTNTSGWFWIPAIVLGIIFLLIMFND